MKKQAFFLFVMALLGAMLGSYITINVYNQKECPVMARQIPVKKPVVQKNTSLNSIVGGDVVVNAVKKLSPSVVFITTRTDATDQGYIRMRPPGLPKQFDQFFFSPYDEYYRSPQEKRGSGSGIVISADGMILTNQHVIDNANRIAVKVDPTPDNNDDDTAEYTAKVVGEDKLYDVAILKIEANGLAPATLGDSERTMVGEWLIAVGNPLGYEHSVTVGVLSARSRNLPMSEREYPNLLQTDAAINPGNSGGPLANLNGEVIGMNTAVSAMGQGIGFAIPINRIKQIKDQLILNGKVDRAFVGINMLPMTAGMAQEMGLLKIKGVLVYRVLSDTPAETAGLQKGDVILEINGQEVNSPEEVQKIIRNSKINSNINLKIWRNMNFENVTVQVGLMPDPDSVKKQ